MRPITALLILLLIVLTGALWLEIQHGLFAPKRVEAAKPLAAAATTAKPAEDVVAPAGPLLSAREDYGPFDDMLERPLFSPSRRPPEIEEAAPAAPSTPRVQAPTGPNPADLLRYALVGTLIADPRRIALLRDPSSPDLIELRVGDRLHGWEVSEVTTQSVIFEQDGRSVELQIAAPPGE